MLRGAIDAQRAYPLTEGWIKKSVEVPSLVDGQNIHLPKTSKMETKRGDRKLIENKCSYRSMEVKLPAILGNYDRQADRPTNGQTGLEKSFTSNKCLTYETTQIGNRT